MSEELTGELDSLHFNERTRIAGLDDLGQHRGEASLGPREAFLVAHERLAILSRVAAGPAFAIAAVDARAQVMASLLLHDRRALILGRHTQCGLRIEDDTVSLRHAAVLVRFKGARPVLHVRDLATGLLFRTEDGQPSAGVIADGPLYISVGSVALWFLPCPGPSLPARAEEAWSALLPRTFLDRRSPSEGMRAASAPSPPARRIDDEITHVTHVAAPLLFGEGDDPEIAWGTLRVAAGGRREWRAVSAERLESGILFGRYGRCGVLLEAQGSVSRVHALLLRVGDEVWLLDTASTNGVLRGEEPVSAHVLGDAETLALGREVTVEWQRLSPTKA